MLQILLVDDERDALEALEWKLNNYIDNVEVKTCDSPLKAIDIINQEKPDVVFLDIQMPEMDGFAMIEKLENRDFNLIFTTAHDEFALKAIKVSAIDYLLKPVDKDELLASMEKIKKSSHVRILLACIKIRRQNQRSKKFRATVARKSQISFYSQ